MRTLYLVRHGCTSANAETPGPELERGWSDISLDASGRQEARRAAKEIVDLKVDALVSSDLIRAKQTAKIIGDALGIEPEFVSQLRTWNLGDLTGKPQAAADRAMPALVRNPDRVPPGGESFSAFRRRVFAALSATLADHQGNVAVIVHANVERLLRAWKARDCPRSHDVMASVFLHGRTSHPGHVEECEIDPLRLKLSHEEADFGEASGPHGADRCGTCKAFGGTDRCTKVLPPLDDDDWCAVGVGRSDGRWFSGSMRK